MTDRIAYEAVGWARRPNGGNLFRSTRRHLHVPGSMWTVCGVHIPHEVMNPRPRSSFIGLVTTLTADEIAQEPECTRCYRRRTR
jgi:hypothetical protein